MQDFSLHIVGNCSRADLKPTYAPKDKATILRRDSFNPEGFDDLEIIYQIQGGDASISFTVIDPGDELLYPGSIRDSIELAFGINRHWSGRIGDIQPVDATGELKYKATGHGPVCARTLPMSITQTAKDVGTWIKELYFGAAGSPVLAGWEPAAGYGYPWLNASDQFVDAATIATVTRKYQLYASSEEIIRDMLSFADYCWGVKPGIDALDELGCYPYWHARERNRVDWIVTLNDVESLADIQITKDWEYYNHLTLEYTDSGGAQQSVERSDADEITSKGTCRAVFAASGNGYLDATNAGVIADALLAYYKKVPRAKGSITLPYGDIQNYNGGKYPVVNIRPGDVLILPHRGLYEYDYSSASTTIDQVTGFLVHEVTIKDSAAQVEIQVGEKVTSLDAMVARLSIEKEAA